MPTCALCQNPAELCQSHIIPEFCYKPIYDAKHRAVVVEPGNPSNRGFAQKGVRSEILCESCEGLINDRYEKPFKAYWYDSDALAPIRAGEKAGFLINIDYTAFKLFHLSILFRASISDHPNFAQVELGPHEERIRQMLLNQDPGEEWRYPIICSAVEGPGGDVWDALVGVAHAIKLEEHKGYHLTFGGAQWVCLVSSHDSKLTEGIRLTSEGRLPIVKLPWMAIDHHRDLHRARSKASEALGRATANFSASSAPARERRSRPSISR